MAAWKSPRAADRDVPRNDDTVGFMIDTFNDGRRAFQFRVNARGVQMDAFNSDIDGSEDWSWDAIWDAKVQIGRAAYTVEIAIPYLAPTPATTHRLFSQYLFSDKLNPQTVLLVGYSDNASGTQAIDLTRTDRTFFTKVGYARVR